MGAVASGVDDTLGDPFVIEVEDLLTEMEVVDEKRSARTDAQGILVIDDRRALRGRKDLMAVLSVLMEFAARAAMEFLVMNGDAVFRRR
jgi:hypothetical protein